jgi:hypothetical protein
VGAEFGVMAESGRSARSHVHQKAGLVDLLADCRHIGTFIEQRADRAGQAHLFGHLAEGRLRQRLAGLGAPTGQRPELTMRFVVAHHQDAVVAHDRRTDPPHRLRHARPLAVRPLIPR